MESAVPRYAQRALEPHADSPPSPIVSVDAELVRLARGRLALRYRAGGDLSRFVLPEPADPARADELWKHTCFEAFIRPESGDAYVEFNLAPSGQWAAYSFMGYRAGMANLDIPAPRIKLARHADWIELETELDLGGVAMLAGVPWRIALTAVIEDTAGARSHWAITHAPGKPDFHAAEGFAINVIPSETT